jgi:uncharacterized membrane protein YfcA
MSEGNESSVMGSKLFQLLSTVYGPYAFGVVSLLIIWYTIVSPQLERQAIDYEKNEKVVETLRGVAASMEAISRSMERTATVLETVVQRVDP